MIQTSLYECVGGGSFVSPVYLRLFLYLYASFCIHYVQREKCDNIAFDLVHIIFAAIFTGYNTLEHSIRSIEMNFNKKYIKIYDLQILAGL